MHIFIRFPLTYKPPLFVQNKYLINEPCAPLHSNCESKMCSSPQNRSSNKSIFLFFVYKYTNIPAQNFIGIPVRCEELANRLTTSFENFSVENVINTIFYNP